MKKVFDQTVRDIKREVNKKVLKVPGIEQKVLDATSNEPWGPHGSLLADIAHATRNYHEYQMIMSVIWKRINDTGKNWRHVYKALTVLEYLVAHGSERVIDEIKEHAYQISTLSGFHYIDSNGRDQGNNVRKKSQTLVDLVNDKERIAEVRQKAAANRDKFRSTPSGMYRPGSYGDRYDDERNEGRYGYKDDDRNGYGYGRDREYNYRDDDRYGRYGDSYNREGDRYGRDYEDRHGRDSYRDDDYRGRSRTYDDYSSRSRSADRDRDRGFDDDAQSSSRGSGKADEQSQNGRGLERKYSEQNIGAPPSYEEAVSESRSPAHSERNGEAPAASVPESSSPPVPQAASPAAPRAASPSAPKAASPAATENMSPAATPFGPSASPAGQEPEAFDEFDPRGPFSAGPAVTAAPTNPPIPTTSNNAEMDLLGSLSDSFSANPLAIVPVTSEAETELNFSGSAFSATQSAPNPVTQSFDDPFGEAPFKAFPSQETNSDPQQPTVSGVTFQPSVSPNADQSQAVASKPETVNNFGFGDSFSAASKPETVNNFGFGDSFSASTYSAPNAYPPSTNPQFSPQDLSATNQETDILAGILPPSGPSPVVAPQAGFSAPTSQTGQLDTGGYASFNPQAGAAVPTNSGMSPQAPQYSSGNFLPQGAPAAPFQSNMHPQAAVTAMHFNNGNFVPQQGSAVPAMPQDSNYSTTGQGPQLSSGFFVQQGSMAPVSSQVSNQNQAGLASRNGNDVLGGLFSQGPTNPVATQAGVPSSSGALVTVPQPSKDKFETKSTVWADTLSRGLVNLNISGPKINPLADIGIDFDAINRKEKRMEKQSPAAVTSTVTMGKAMGAGSGIGRAGASVLRAPQTPMVNSGMSMGMGVGGVPGAGMGYGGMNPGMGMNMGMNPGMGVNMGMSTGAQMRPQTGYVPGSTMPGGYNPMMGMGGYTPQQPYGGGYR